MIVSKERNYICPQIKMSFVKVNLGNFRILGDLKENLHEDLEMLYFVFSGLLNKKVSMLSAAL